MTYQNYLMRDLVQLIIELITHGTMIMDYALLVNQDKPLKAEVVLSVSYLFHHLFVCCSGAKGSFWICAFSIYQNNDVSKGAAIVRQLGPGPKIRSICDSLTIYKSNVGQSYT